MVQQTAVEWLVDNLPQRFKNVMMLTGEKIIEQAKAIEREQIMMAFNDGKVNSILNKRNSEQYYNQTYKK